MSTWGFVAALAAVCLVIAGFLLADLPGIGVCSGAIYDTNRCEAAQLRQSIFASALVVSGVIAVAVVAAAFIVGAANNVKPDPEKLPEAH